MENNRLDFPDAARGIAILAVILGHSLYVCTASGVELLSSLIFSFHMPLFFMVSGYFYSNKKGGIAKSAKALLIPYVLLSLFSVIVSVIFHPDYDIPSHLLSILYGNASPLRAEQFLHNMPVIDMVWFLMALFFCRLIYRGLDAFGKKYNVPVSLLVLTVFLAGIALNKYIWLPFNIQPAMGGVLFYHIGYELRQRKIITEPDRSKLVILIIAAVLWVCAVFFGKVRMESNLYENFISVIGAVCGAFLVFWAAKYLAKVPFIGRCLKWAGRNSIVIFCFHEIEAGRYVIVDFLSKFIETDSYLCLILFFVIRLTLVILATLIFTKLRDIYKRHKAVRSPQ